MRKVTITLTMEVHDNDFNSKVFQEEILKVDESELKVDFKRDFPESNLIGCSIEVR